MALATLGYTACQQPTPPAETETQEVMDTTSAETTNEAGLDVDSMAQTQMNKRKTIEAAKSELTRKDLKTDSLRAQVAQKWALIHFYFDGDQLVRVKSYPHGEVSARTEEFYFDQGQLIAAVIEDNGLAETDGEAVEDDKAYYFYDNELVKEVNNTQESETSIRESDAERLLQEAKEYEELAAKL